MAQKYKWDSPQEWLIEYAGKLNAGELFNEFTVLVQQMDADQIQDLYQSDMERDGYFLKTCTENTEHGEYGDETCPSCDEEAGEANEAAEVQP